MFQNMSFVEIIDLLAQLVTLIGVPAAIYVFLEEKRKERREREYGTYHALDEKYLEYLDYCLQHPELNLYHIPLERKHDLTDIQQIQQYAMFDMLISLMERAFLMYRDQSNKIKKAQWDGWNEYMIDWCNRDDFCKLWEICGDQWDEEFTDHMNALIAQR